MFNEYDYNNAIMEEVRLFYPDYDGEPAVSLKESGENFIVNVGGKVYLSPLPAQKESALLRKRLRLRAAKLAVYLALHDFTGKSFPWGSLTGIRPSKLAYEFLSRGGDFAGIERYFSKTFLVDGKKARLMSDIIRNQKGFCLRNEKLINLYIHIPFCPSRCSYCSFVSLDAVRYKNLIEPYCLLLRREIETTVLDLKQKGYSIYSIYVGGGTPTALPPRYLQTILAAAAVPQVEFTCEAGRPDTIDGETVSLMRNNGVNRISVNPQSLNDLTLSLAGRRHTAADFFRAYETAAPYFDINVDLIAGLKGDDFDSFRMSLECVAALRPANITVHTLARKHGSKLIESPRQEEGDCVRMIDYAAEKLDLYGYLPYYLYRQKSMQSNLENVGYTLPGKQCVNNITVMEEFISVAACGAGAINKRIFPGGRIERLANLRDVELYRQNFDSRLEKKLEFF